MRGSSHPCGFVIYDKEKAIIGIEDLSSLMKFLAMIVGIFFLAEITQQTVLLLLAFICLIKMVYEWSEWHAIEHKLIYLLENKLPLTIDNLKKTPMKHERCGVGNKFLRKPSVRKMSMALKATRE